MTEQTGQTLTPNEIKVVDFYGDEIISAMVHTGDETSIYVPLRPICEYLGLSWGSQRNRIMRDEIVAGMTRGVFITNTPGTGGGTQEMLCLPLDLLPGFLFGISTARVKPELKEKITRYRRECFRVLWAAFKHEIIPATQPTPAVLSGAALAYELATAVANLAREQMEIEARVTKAAKWAIGIEERVTALELRLSDDQAITEAQATDLALAVKTVANALEQRGTNNAYQRVYGELYRLNGVTSYKNLPRDRFDSVIEWLRNWHKELESTT